MNALLRYIGLQVGTVVAQEPGHVHARTARGEQGHRVAGGLPGAGHVGDEAEAGLVVVVAVEVAGLGQVAQQVQVEGGGGEGQRVTLSFQGVAYPLKPPPPGFLSADSAPLSSTGRRSLYSSRSRLRVENMIVSG